MRAEPTLLPEVLLLTPEPKADARGWLLEAWRRETHAALGLPRDFAQDNLVESRPGVLRGLHLQHPDGQGKLIQVLAGAIFDVAVDLRVGSPRFGRHVALRLLAAEHRQLWVPPGFAHGYAVLGAEPALVLYKCSTPYRPEHELGLRWDDPELAIAWPTRQPVLSPKDAAAPTLAQLDRARLPRYEAGARPA